MKPDELFEVAKEGAQCNLEEHPSLAPIALALHEGKIAVCPLPMADRETARMAMAACAEQFQVFVTINEVYLAKLRPGETVGDCKPPSERDDREEAVMVTLFVEGKLARSATMKFVRKEDKLVSHEEWQEPDPAKGEYMKAPPGSIYPNPENSAEAERFARGET